jgi:hypothetical protein
MEFHLHGFIEKLPLSVGFDTILVIVDRFTKQSLFIPMYDTITSIMLAKLFVLHVFSKHGVQSHVTSNCGSEFVSSFFRSFRKALNMELHFTSGHHPKGDGQTEQMNQTLEQYLRVYCNYQQDNWADLLPIAEFAYNNTPNATTGISPFCANKGYHLNISVHLEKELTSSRTHNFITDLDKLHQYLRDTISAAQKRYQISADCCRTPALDFQIGEKVFVKVEHFRTTRPSKKLSEKYLGPFDIITRAGSRSFTLQLPDHFRSVHLVFHVSMLEPATPNKIPDRVQSPPPPITIKGEPEYKISETLDSKIDQRYKCKLQYLVRWTGYEGTDEESSWISASKLDHASESVSDFHTKYPLRPGPLPIS